LANTQKVVLRIGELFLILIFAFLFSKFSFHLKKQNHAV